MAYFHMQALEVYMSTKRPTSSGRVGWDEQEAVQRTQGVEVCMQQPKAIQLPRGREGMCREHWHVHRGVGMLHAAEIGLQAAREWGEQQQQQHTAKAVGMGHQAPQAAELGL